MSGFYDGMEVDSGWLIERQVFGYPASKLFTSGRAERVVEAGAVGEVAMADLLADVCRRRPEVRVWHSVADPAGGDIDHVVLIPGVGVWAINAARWGRGRYAAVRDGDRWRLLRDGDMLPVERGRVLERTDRWQSVLPGFVSDRFLVVFGATGAWGADWFLTADGFVEMVEAVLVRTPPVAADLALVGAVHRWAGWAR